jgi:hypothetical protein
MDRREQVRADDFRDSAYCVAEVSHMNKIFESIYKALGTEAFWAAVGVLVTIGGLLVALRKWVRNSQLQTVLNNERRFYEVQARRVAPPAVKLPEESAIDRYIHSINTGLVSIEELPESVKREAKERIRKLIAQLSATHASLIKALSPFEITEAKRFFEGFDQFNQEFGSLYNAGEIPRNTRTHCTEVEETVAEIIAVIQRQMPEWAGLYKLQELGYSMRYADQEVIVPIMVSILAKTEVELSLIRTAIEDDNKKKALWLKERYRFDIHGLFGRLNTALNQMHELTNKL